MKEYDTYLLDFDGTLFDTKESLKPVFRKGFGAIGIEVTDRECEVFMHHTLLQAAEMKHVREDQFKPLVDAITIAMDSEEVLSLIKPFSDTVYLISELRKRNKKVAIVSGNLSNHIRLVLSLYHLDAQVDAVVGSDMFKHGKPHPEPLLLAMEMLGVSEKRSTVYVGDSLQDEQAAEAAGIDSVLIARDDDSREAKKTTIAEFAELFRY
jgi:HAD superfamily hydrolase (TIGR01549 family)